MAISLKKQLLLTTVNNWNKNAYKKGITDLVLVDGPASIKFDTFSRAGEAYSYGLAYEVTSFADGLPRVNRRGLYASDVALPANLITAPNAPVGETLSLVAGTYTMQVWGRGRATITGPGGAVGFSSPDEPLTFTVASTGNHTIVYSGTIQKACLRMHAFAEHFATAAVSAETAILPLGLRPFCYIEGMFREIGRTQELAFTWADGSTITVERAVDGKLRLVTVIDGTTVQSGYTSNAYAGTGCAILFKVSGSTVSVMVNGENKLSASLSRQPIGAVKLQAHKWRSYLSQVLAFAKPASADIYAFAPEVYKLSPFVQPSMGDNVEIIETYKTITSDRIVCNTNGTFELYYSWNSQEGFSVGQNVYFSYWDGGTVGGLTLQGNTYVVAAQLSSPLRIQFTAAGAVADGVSKYGNLTTVSTGFQTATVFRPKDFVTLLSNNDKVEILATASGLTHGSCNLAGLSLTHNSSRRMTGATGATGQINFHGQSMKLKVTRIAPLVPIIIDMDKYTAAGELAMKSPPFNPTTKQLYASGTFNASTQFMDASQSLAPTNETPIIVIGRTTDDQTGSLAFNATTGTGFIGDIIVKGGVWRNTTMSTTGSKLLEGTILDNIAQGLAGNEADLYFARILTYPGRKWRYLAHNCNFYNAGGSLGGNHSDAMQIQANTAQPDILSATGTKFEGTYQIIGQLSVQQGINDVTVREQPAAIINIEDASVMAPENVSPGGAFFWLIDAAASGGFQKNGNRAKPTRFNGVYANVAGQTLITETQAFTNIVPGVVDAAANNAVVRVNGTIAGDGITATYDKALGWLGSIIWGDYPRKTRMSRYDRIGGLGRPGRRYLSMLEAQFSGYLAGLRQVPLAFRRSVPVEIDWQQSNISGTTVTLALRDTDPLNPVVTLKLYRSVATGTPTVIPETVAEAQAFLVSTISGFPASATITNTLASGNGAYYRIGTIRADGTEQLSSMWNTRAA